MDFKYPPFIMLCKFMSQLSSEMLSNCHHGFDLLSNKITDIKITTGLKQHLSSGGISVIVSTQ